MSVVAKTDNALYDSMVSITYNYLGPVTDRFMARQVRSHLCKDPGELQKRDLVKLIDWISLAMAVLVEDEKLVESYVASLKGLI